MEQMEQMEQLHLGNTKPNANRGKYTNRWCFTLNNYSEEEYKNIMERLNTHKYIIGKEANTSSGTPHLQGYIELKNTRKRLQGMKKLLDNERIHLEPAKGNREQNFQYCSKEENYVSNLYPPTKKEIILKAKFDNIKWKTWQQEIINIIEGPKEERIINWFWEPTGNIGKSFLAKYIYCKYTTIIGDGKKEDVLHQVIKFQEEHEKEPEVILLDIPRYNHTYINYGLIEKLKDGLAFSGKYEGGIVLLENTPHIICFANYPPNKEFLSEDRWNIIKLI